MVRQEDSAVPRVRDCVGGQLGWCLGPRACRLCCASFPSATESTSTRTMYLGLMASGTILMAAMLTPDIQHNLQSAFKDFNATCIDLNISDNCMQLTGYMALYKVSFGISVFFTGLALVSVGVTSSTGCRASIHNGFWAWKLAVLALLCVTTFVIPVPHLDSFHTGWLYCALGGACIFLLVQMVLVTDLARDLTLPRPLPPPSPCPSRCVRLALTTAAALILTTFWITSYTWLLIRYTGASCMSTNTIIISCNAALSALITILTLSPCTKKATGGFVPALLQSAIVCCYLVYLTWCTVTSTPETALETEDEYYADSGYMPEVGPYRAGLEPYAESEVPVVEDSGCSAWDVGDRSSIEETWIPYTGIAIMFLVLLHNSVTAWTSNPAQVLGLKLGEDVEEDPGLCVCCRPGVPREPFPPGPPAQEQDGGQHIIRNERMQTVYSYSLFHATLCLSNMYVTMQLTQWFQPQEATIISFNKSWSTVILKTISTWLSVLVYLATLVIPAWRPPHSSNAAGGSGHLPTDLWASEETACLQTSHI